MVPTVRRFVEIPQVHLLDKIVDILVCCGRQVPMALPLLKSVQVPHLQFIDNFVDIPVVVVQRQGTMVLSVQRPVEIPQVLFLAILLVRCCATTGAHGLQ